MTDDLVKIENNNNLNAICIKIILISEYLQSNRFAMKDQTFLRVDEGEREQLTKSRRARCKRCLLKCVIVSLFGIILSVCFLMLIYSQKENP